MAETATYRAVICDMDGVLTDSEPAFHTAVNDILSRYGKSVGLDEYRQFIGMATPAMWTRMIALKGLPATLDEILDAYEQPLMARLREPRPPLPGAPELIYELKRGGVPVGLCTASYRRWLDAILASAGLSGRFDAIVAGDDIAVPKPDPEPYAKSAERLGMRPEECIVVEDSMNGLTSALRSGACVVQLRATSTAADPVPGVALVIERLDEFPLEWLAP